jgi:hypothetical protein
MKILITSVLLFTLIGCNNNESDYQNSDKLKDIYLYDIKLLTYSVEKRNSLNPPKVAPMFYRVKKINANFKDIFSLLGSVDNKSKILDILGENYDLIYYTKDSTIDMRINILKKELEKDFDNQQIKLLLYELNCKMLRNISESIDKNDYKFNRVYAIVIPEKTVIRQGETYHSNIIMAAYDSTHYPKIKVMNEEIPVEYGRGILSIQSKNKGLKNYSGEIEWYKEDLNQTVKLPFVINFEVK